METMLEVLWYSFSEAGARLFFQKYVDEENKKIPTVNNLKSVRKENNVPQYVSELYKAQTDPALSNSKLRSQ
jgi:hypothetical protein